MKLPINLATEPFRPTRAMLVASSAVATLLTGLLGLMIWLAVNERHLQADTRAEIERLEAQVAKLTNESAQLETFMRRTDNAEVLDRSQFLNVLLARKGVAWTKIFSDLEGVLPHTVRLVSIRPQITSQNEIMLDMVVGAQSGEPVIEFLRNLESSPLFGTTNVHNWLPPSQTDPLYRYRVSVTYAQKL